MEERSIMVNASSARNVVIDGATRLLAIVGDPIAQARSPALYNARIAAAGVNAVMVPWHAPTQDFEAVMRGLQATANLDGIVITYPFKQRALHLAMRVSVMAGRIGAVNALRREQDGSWTGGMFDGDGLIEAIEGLGRSVSGSRIKLLGAGGAGGAIAHAVAEHGAASLSIFDTDRSRLSALACDLASFYPACQLEVGRPEIGDAEILVNATPVGLDPQDGLPVDLPDLTSKVAVVDIVPRKEGTALLALAASLGCPHVGGAAMVQGQAGIVLDFFGIVTGGRASAHAGTEFA
ncbi:MULTISPECIES: shikimate dehydrogenase [unclassified Sinorhizobium]|uniref:shikimate dehydrogenase family protein n=1 Tax=unclassified Sinorhizobium TaxID=2613772 RepID=UPI003525E76D